MSGSRPGGGVPPPGGPQLLLLQGGVYPPRLRKTPNCNNSLQGIPRRTPWRIPRMIPRRIPLRLPLEDPPEDPSEDPAGEKLHFLSFGVNESTLKPTMLDRSGFKKY